MTPTSLPSGRRRPPTFPSGCLKSLFFVSYFLLQSRPAAPPSGSGLFVLTPEAAPRLGLPLGALALAMWLALFLQNPFRAASRPTAPLYFPHSTYPYLTLCCLFVGGQGRPSERQLDWPSFPGAQGTWFGLDPAPPCSHAPRVTHLPGPWAGSAGVHTKGPAERPPHTVSDSLGWGPRQEAERGLRGRSPCGKGPAGSGGGRRVCLPTLCFRQRGWLQPGPTLMFKVEVRGLRCFLVSKGKWNSPGVRLGKGRL